jgi:alkanesulfonate monooxygenase SsuD/methylene tetrahydromethanopterin reductase-like flavin-dependent oxidoreductase (luciferase family)
MEHGGRPAMGVIMKFVFFPLNPYRELPPDFEDRYESVYVTPPNDELCDPARAGQFYNWTLDEYEHAARLGFDGLGINEHHQNAYGYFNSPNLFAAALARTTRDAALVLLGNTLALYQPALRVAEDIAVLDTLSGGRVVAGLPVGTPMDTSFVYGVTPSQVRSRFHEARDLILQAWTRPGPFHFNGRFTKLRYVNPWPKPLQQPHPPIWLAGGQSLETFELAAREDYAYNFLNFNGYKFALDTMRIFWETVERHGKEKNPFQGGFFQQVVVADTDTEAERLYLDHVQYFYRKCLHIPPYYFAAPGYTSKRSADFQMRRSPAAAAVREAVREGKWSNYIEHGIIIAGSPDTVADRLAEAIKGLHIGHLMASLQIGSMPHELTLQNLTLFAEKVMPRLRGIWDAEGWADPWWPSGASAPASNTASA